MEPQSGAWSGHYGERLFCDGLCRSDYSSGCGHRTVITSYSIHYTKLYEYVLGTIGGNIQNGTLTTELQEVPLGSVTSQQILNFPNELTYPTVPTTEVSFAGNLGVSEDPLGMSADIISDDAENAHKDLRLLFTKSEEQPEP